MLSPLPICLLVRLFSLFYDCALVAVSPCHHGNLLSLFLATHFVCACAECSAVAPRYLYAQHHKSVFECLCAVCSISMSEELLIGGPRSCTLKHILSDLHTESFEVWQWELDRIRQAAAVWYSCHPLPTAAVSQPQAQPISTGIKASVYSHTWPLTPTFRTCHSRILQP